MHSTINFGFKGKVLTVLIRSEGMDYDLLKKQIHRVNKAFYDRVFKDQWLGAIFKDVNQAHIENQQTDFMIGAFGGPKVYSGRNPIHAHVHIFVNEEIWILREKYLKEAFLETDLPEEVRVKWIKIDEAFKNAILKKSYNDCTKRFTMDEIVYYPSPASAAGVKKAA